MSHESGRPYETYSDLLRDVSVAYERDAEEALALLSAHGPGFEKAQGHVYLFRASLTNRLKRGQEAIAILEEALAVGIRIPERALRGSRGLASLAGTPSFAAVVRALDAAYVAALTSTSPTLLVSEPSGAPPSDGWPVLMALHGNNSTPGLEQEHWAPITESGWLLALVGSSQPAWTPGYLIWDDRDRSQRDVLWAFEHLSRERPAAGSQTVLGGFSAGGFRALEIGLGGLRLCAGIFTVAASLPEELVNQILPPAPSAADVRTFMVIGDRDTSAGAHQVMQQRLVAAGMNCVLDVRPGLGHQYPPQMRETLSSVLGFLTQRGTHTADGMMRRTIPRNGA